tara:strand:+ start:36 stop:683 length:648 start_codon:yes stop_codon:yes gene_type:complete
MGFLLLVKTKILSFIVRNINGDLYHNASKFHQINKIWRNIKLDQIPGDYIEFGIYKGKSLYHSIKSAETIGIKDDRIFWGLDSFEGFPVENHNFYKNYNFKTSYKKVSKQFKNYKNTNIVKGFFKDSLQTSNLQNLKTLSFAFIDCDIYESTIDIFNYLKTRMANGGFLMIDDFTSIDKNGNSISKSFFSTFDINQNVFVFGYYSNGIIFRYIKN